MTKQIESLATLENAQAYAKETDQWVFVKVLIEDLDIRATDSLIEELENAFDALAFPNLESEIYSSPMYKRNYDKFGDCDSCCCCARPLNENECKRIHINIDHKAMVNTILSEEDAERHGFISQGYMFIGNSCAKKMSKEFIHA